MDHEAGWNEVGIDHVDGRGAHGGQAPEVENLLLEHMRAIRAQLDDLSRGLGELRGRVSSMERHLANVQTDIAMIHQRLDEQGIRIERIARRLELTPERPQEAQNGPGARRGSLMHIFPPSRPSGAL